MLSKKGRGMPDHAAASPSKRLKNNLSDLFLSNQVSGVRSKNLFEDAVSAGVADIGKLAKGGRRNAARDMLSLLMRKSKWPPLYYAHVNLWNYKTCQEEAQQIAFLLPHEIVGALLKYGSIEAIQNTCNVDDDSRSHLDSCKRELGVESLLGLGLWCDGVPCNWDRSESLEVITMNLPGLGDDYKRLRVPIAVVPKKFMIKEKTYDDIMGVIVWSLKCLAVNSYPAKRHDDTVFLLRRIRGARNVVAARLESTEFGLRYGATGL